METKEEFKVGQRVFFPLRHGINAYGKIIEVHPENSSVMILADNLKDKCERLMSVVTVVKE